MVERNLAKVEVASSNLVSRSNISYTTFQEHLLFNKNIFINNRFVSVYCLLISTSFFRKLVQSDTFQGISKYNSDTFVFLIDNFFPSHNRNYLENSQEKSIMALTDAVIKNSKPQLKAYTLKDIQVPNLFIAPSGSKIITLSLYLTGQAETYLFKSVPHISLKEAQWRCEDADLLVKKVRNPGYVTIATVIIKHP